MVKTAPRRPEPVTTDDKTLRVRGRTYDRLKSIESQTLIRTIDLLDALLEGWAMLSPDQQRGAVAKAGEARAAA